MSAFDVTCPAPGPLPVGHGRPLTRPEVMEAGKTAWSESVQGSAYYFDGASFWSCLPLPRRPVIATETPIAGWRHRASCNCPRCWQR